MKRALSWLMPSLLALAAVPAAAALDRATFVALSGSILRVEAPRAAGGLAIGTGVAVGPDAVVTNCHVTRDARHVEVVSAGARWAVDGQVSDVERDLCLLRVPGLPARAVPLGRASDLVIGQPVAALGYTGGIGLQHSFGEVVDLHRFGSSQVIQSNSWFGSGASGGGLFDDAGRLVGILTFHLRGGASQYFAAPVDWVQELLAAGDGAFERVLPLGVAAQPYWQAMPGAQPRFLRAAALMLDDRWPELESLAADWSRADPEDGEAWYLLGVALRRLGRPDEARSALECALRLQPERAVARSQLAEIVVAAAAEPALSCRTGTAR